MSRSKNDCGSKYYSQSLTLSARNHRSAATCYPTVMPRLLTTTVFSPRCFDVGSPTSCWPSARTNFNVGEDPTLQSHPSKAESNDSSCKSQVTTPYYTKYLEGKITTMQEQHKNVAGENMDLNNQLSKLATQTRELEEKAAALEEALIQEKHKREVKPKVPKQQAHHRSSNTTETRLHQSFDDASTSTNSPEKYECGVQASLVVMPNFQENENSVEPVQRFSIEKTELESLEADMLALRDAIRAKEEFWNETSKREQNYRKNLALLSAELFNAQQLADTRYNELMLFEQKLKDNKEELRTTQKELALAKKTLKLQKQQRCPEEQNNCNVANNPDIKEKPRSRAGDSKSNSQPSSPVARQKFRITLPAKDAKVTQRQSSRDSTTYSPRVDSLT